jgi:hypothetical protein
MKITTPAAIIIVGALLTSGLVFQALAQRYELTGGPPGNGGAFVRIDRLTGQTDVCFVATNEKLHYERYIAPCDGRNHEH